MLAAVALRAHQTSQHNLPVLHPLIALMKSPQHLHQHLHLHLATHQSVRCNKRKFAEDQLPSIGCLGGAPEPGERLQLLQCLDYLGKHGIRGIRTYERGVVFMNRVEITARPDERALSQTLCLPS